MIDYKLAKQLKELGFPGMKLFWYIPTLSELIEACGKEFWQLSQLTVESGHTRDLWVASGMGNLPQVTGKTKEIAMAKLYMKLNKK